MRRIRGLHLLVAVGAASLACGRAPASSAVPDARVGPRESASDAPAPAVDVVPDAWFAPVPDVWSWDAGTMPDGNYIASWADAHFVDSCAPNPCEAGTFCLTMASFSFCPQPPDWCRGDALTCLCVAQASWQWCNGLSCTEDGGTALTCAGIARP